MTILPKTAIYILISFAVGLLCILYIRSRDRFEKEPYGHLLAVAVWGGGWAWVFSGWLYRLLDLWRPLYLENAWGAMLVIGPVEESAKLAGMAASWFIYRKELNEPVDGLLYMACVALGYSLIENVDYAHHGGSTALLTRLLICTPAHINFSVFMGLAFYFAIRNRRAWPMLAAAFIYACLTHGVYDLVIFNHYFVVVLALVLWLTYKAAAGLLGYALAKSRFRTSLNTYLTSTAQVYHFPGLPCPYCGDLSDKATRTLFSKNIQLCGNCGHYVTTRAGLRALLHHFTAAPARNFLGRPRLGTKPYADGAIRAHGDGVTVGFNAKTLDRLIEQSNQQTISRLEAHRWFPRNWLS